MKKFLILIIIGLSLSGCATFAKYEGVDPKLKLPLILYPGMSESEPQAMRAKFEKNAPRLMAELSAVEHIEDIIIPGTEIPARIYTPNAGGPVLIFYHGGAFFMGSIDTHENISRYIAANLPCTVISVGYRLAPEHPYPAAQNDAYAALEWASANFEQPLFVAGDSAGGALAAAVSLMARDRQGPSIAGQLLIYPVLDMSENMTPSREKYLDGFFLSERIVRLAKEVYAPDENDIYASPLAAQDLSNLPPAIIITAEFDPLRDEGEIYGKRLNAAGVPVRQTRYEGMVHGFISMDALLEQAHQALDECIAVMSGLLMGQSVTQRPAA